MNLKTLFFNKIKSKKNISAKKINLLKVNVL